MLAKRIIPCLDVKDGRVVKGVQFLDLRDAGDPAQIAEVYDREGADEIVFLDITASHEERPIFIDVVKRTAENIFIPLTVGGGIETLDTIERLLRAGADKVSINTMAVQQPDFIRAAATRFGTQCVVVAIDAKREGQGWGVYTHGGRRPTGKDALLWAKEAADLGAGEILLTSMDCDGTKNGFDIELTRSISEATNIPIIASGGAGTLEHLRLALVEGKADAALAASIFHFKEHTIKEAKEFLKGKGVEIRL